MSGEAFGIVDLLSDQPRVHCEDCGSRLLWGDDALGVLTALDMESRQVFVQWWREGGNVYGCPKCGLCGVFSVLYPMDALRR